MMIIELLYRFASGQTMVLAAIEVTEEPSSLHSVVDNLVWA